MRARLGSCVAWFALALCGGCASDRPWTFGVTRAVWEEGFDDAQLEALYEGDDPQDALRGLTAVVVVLPLALDVVLLPVTVTHDVMVR